MSDEQTEQERDAAVIARYREALVWIMREESGEAVGLKTANRSREMFDVRQRDFADAALRAINRLTAELDAARAEVERLRAACAGISEGLIRTATHGVENLTKRDWLIQTAQNITAALETRGIR